ncbi:hypothetical protein [Duganella phyllosphaerae]|uniref:Uncharacterized protein n=1 Tax=Duganella phyllosphaerae TaxID=762836 RepID=A0A1E7WH71_9BURK|nr:hypothetical protein [Duganella phyllosphaerae]OEZ97968.1 hypothetical protein DUPY_32390 [Duganella phyllosphaerae]
MGLAISIKDQALIELAKATAFDFNRADRAAGHLFQWWLIDDLAYERKGLPLTDAERAELLCWLEEPLGAYQTLQTRSASIRTMQLHTADRIARWEAKLREPELDIATRKEARAAFEGFAKQADEMTTIALLEDFSARYRDNNFAGDASRVDAAAHVQSASQSRR